jgi:hypothetical protein
LGQAALIGQHKGDIAPAGLRVECFSQYVMYRLTARNYDYTFFIAR